MTGDLKLIPNNLAISTTLFLSEKEKLEKVLSNFTIQVEHVGSTALPGTIGKGILDVLLICESVDEQGHIKDVLVANGYIQGELNKVPDGRLFFVNHPGKTEAGDLHLHLVVKGSNNLQSLIFRDYLLDHPDELKKYNQEKQKLAQLTHNSRYDYAVNKATFIEDLMRRI